MSQDAVMMNNKQNSNRVKIIKRYQNRKLYDTQQSCYVTLDDISKMIRANEEVMVIDNKTKNDITAATLTQIIFEAEKKAAQYAPLYTLREIIQNANGSISSYLSKLGAFPQDYHKNQPQPQPVISPEVTRQTPSYDDVKQTLEERVANAANAAAAEAQADSILPTSSANQASPLQKSNEGDLTLPNSNQSLDN